METQDYLIPEFYLPALINGDDTGLNEGEVNALNRFVDDELKIHKTFCCLAPSDEESDGLMRYHDLQPYGILECETRRVTFQIG